MNEIKKRKKKTDFFQKFFTRLFPLSSLLSLRFPHRLRHRSRRLSRNRACSTRTSGRVSSESAAAGREKEATSNQTAPFSLSPPPFPSSRNTEKLSAPARTCEEQVVALTEKERPGDED